MKYLFIQGHLFLPSYSVSGREDVAFIGDRHLPFEGARRSGRPLDKARLRLSRQRGSNWPSRLPHVQLQFGALTLFLVGRVLKRRERIPCTPLPFPLHSKHCGPDRSYSIVAPPDEFGYGKGSQERPRSPRVPPWGRTTTTKSQLQTVSCADYGEDSIWGHRCPPCV